MNSNIKLIIVKDYEEMSKKAFDVFKNEIENGAKNLGMATGSTPVGLYKLFIEDYKSNKVYEDLNYYNLDEYFGLDKTHSQSYYSFMKAKLFDHINAKNTFIPNGDVKDISKAIDDYQIILDNTQIDVQLLGIGNNGHIGFNEPGTPFDIKTNYVRLKNSTREANKRFFNNDIDSVPTYAITMGISDIMNAKKIVVLANGESKATALNNMLFGDIDNRVPASILQNHPDVTVIVDYKAASKLPLDLISVDVSSTRIKVAKFNSNLEQLDYLVVHHKSVNVYEQIVELIGSQISNSVFKIGISISGYLHNGVISNSKLNLINFDLKTAIEEKFQMQTILLNRANASAYGEYFTNYLESDSLYYISFATGVGGGYVHNGEVVNGCRGLTGEIGNVLVDYHEFSNDYFADGSLQLHYDNFKISKDEVHFAKQAGQVIANIVNILDPCNIIIDIKNEDINSRIVSEIEKYVNNVIYKEVSDKVVITMSTLNDESVIGMATYTKNYI